MPIRTVNKSRGSSVRHPHLDILWFWSILFDSLVRLICRPLMGYCRSIRSIVIWYAFAFAGRRACIFELNQLARFDAPASFSLMAVEHEG